MVVLVNFMYFSSISFKELEHCIEQQFISGGMIPIVPVTQVCGGVVRILGMNPGPFTLQGTNTYLLGAGSHRLLIDTSDGNDLYISLLESSLRENQVQSLSILITHGHFDHIGGIEGIRNTIRVHKVYDHSNLTDGQVILEGDVCVEAFYTPGHKSDHFSFAMNKVLFSGDCVLGDNSSTVFDDLNQYMQSLQKLSRIIKEKNISIVAPAHGNLIFDGGKKIEMDYKHRLLREEQIIKTLKSIHNIRDIVLAIYGDQLDESLMKAAEHSTQLHLNRLVSNGLVINTNGTFYLLKNKSNI